LGPGLRLLFVGINPGLWTAAANAHFARPGNRFWPALHLAGITATIVDASAGMPAEAAADLVERGVGITNLVARATARADELTTSELQEGGRRLLALVEQHRPTVVAVLGLTAYRAAFQQRKAVAGRQPEPLGGATLWVLPNPSGLNAHETLASLASAYRAAAEVAGVVLAT
jgi:TDG/mug DNA glycosylase family protein